jgi:surface carbohydrate biosynthesis protein
MNIYIFIEIKRRELSSRLLLALESAKRGHDVYIGDLTPYLEKELLKPGIIHHKSLTPKIERINEIKKLKKKYFLFTSQDEESGHINDDPKEYIETRYGKKSLELVEKVFTWGKFDLENLTKKYPKLKNKFFNTGNPRVDFWKNENKIFYNNNLIKFKNYILVSSNFETICGYRNLADTIDWLRKLGYFKRGWKEEKIIERAKIEHIIFNDFVRLIKKISLIYRKKKIIFRPHPIERVEDWKKIFFKHKNILINNSHEIGHWITNSSMVIHNGCTGGLEAALRNKKVLSYSPKKLNIGHKFPNKVSQNSEDLSKALNLVKKFSKKETIFFSNNKIKEIDKRFQNYFNQDAYIKIVDEWEKIGNKNISNHNNIKKLKLLGNILKMKLKLKRYKNLDNKFSDFSVDEINFLIKNMSRIDRNFAKLKVDFISGKLIRISKI